MTSRSLNSNNININLPGKRQYQVYQSIISKFLINLPLQQRKDISRLSYHCQKAWYYFIDSVLQLKDDSQISSDKKYQFFTKLKQYSPKVLSNLNPDIIQTKLRQNKPTCGAIILNQNDTKVVVIKSKYGLGFPKGKWNQSQQPQQCAARQVYEQIGLYIHKKVDPQEKVQFFNKEGVPSVFFVVRGIKQSQKFKIDKKQIQNVFWMSISDINKNIRGFVGKSQRAWKGFWEEFYPNLISANGPKYTIEQFIKDFNKEQDSKSPNKKQKNLINKQNQLTNIPFKQASQEQINPFLSFKFDRQKLMSVFV